MKTRLEYKQAVVLHPGCSGSITYTVGQPMTCHFMTNQSNEIVKSIDVYHGSETEVAPLLLINFEDGDVFEHCNATFITRQVRVEVPDKGDKT